jgi:hypothetical protein
VKKNNDSYLSKSLRFLLVKGEIDEEFLLEKWMDITAAVVLIKHFCLTFWW